MSYIDFLLGRKQRIIQNGVTTMKTLLALTTTVATISPALATTSGSPEGGIGFLLILAAVYFLPAIVASSRHHRNRLAIGILNLLLGWTVLGWIVAMVWACTSDVEPRPEVKYTSRWSKERRQEANPAAGPAPLGRFGQTET
jgi:hypothetical protein